MQNQKVALAIFILFVVIAVVQLIYYFIVYGKFAFHRKKNALSLREIPLSVVIVVRDNASQVLQTLPKFLEQQYPNYEIVIVNDRSPDEQSVFAIKEYQKRFSNVKFIDLRDAVSTSRGRKMAVSMGIKCSSYGNIVITDPDCLPASEHWLSNLSQNIQGQKKIVLGYSTYIKRRTPYNAFLHFDKLVGAVQYFSLALYNSTYRGDFSNIVFMRNLFYQQKGFTSFNHLQWGEEDIFIHNVATPTNTAIEYNPDSAIISQNVPSYGYWRLHKISLFFTRKFNSLKNRAILSSYNITNLLFYIFLVFAILMNITNPIFLYTTIGIAVVRIASMYVVFGISAKKLNEKQIIPHLLFYDILFSLLNPLYWSASKLNNKKIS